MSSRLCWILSKLSASDSDFGMRGLPNYCLSCCVNTLLQTFSATWELAEILDKWETSGVRMDSRNVPLQLKKVLAAMRSDLSQPAPHQDFLHCLDRHRFQLHRQHDADEVFLSVLDLMQQQMDDESLALQIKNLYKISVETYLQCLVCDSVQTRASFLLSLPLHVKEDDNSLESCLNSYFEPQELKGINCCFCAQCDTKTQSKQGYRLISLPRILCMHLKRFRNSSRGTRKLDCTVTFPETFNVAEILKGAFSTDFAQTDCRYTLHAVVVHSGHAMCGHYTAYVRHRKDQRWYYANDSHVRQTSWEEVKTAYGGYRKDTAYMLMYRRSLTEDGQQPEFSG